LAPDIWVWTLLRFITGLCLAGQYVVAESWLNQLVDNSSRGRLLAIYGIVTIGGFALGQLLLGAINPQNLTGFAVAAMLVSLAVAPVSLSEDAAPPAIRIPEGMALRELMSIVPTGVVACMLVGLAHGAYFGFSAVYAARAGLSVGQVGRFVAVGSLGSVLLQFPISAASDDVDRRAVGVLAALSAAAAAGMLIVTGPYGWQGHLWMLLLGGTTYPLYSIAGAYTSDWLPPERMTAAASQLVLLFGAGAMVGPLLVSVTMRYGGTDAFAWTVVVLHLAIAAFLVARMLIYRAPLTSKPRNDVGMSARVFYIPATVVSMGRRIRDTRGRERDTDD
jgi:MFS family permease